MFGNFKSLELSPKRGVGVKGSGIPYFTFLEIVILKCETMSAETAVHGRFTEGLL